jgi:hypothetical protein
MPKTKAQKRAVELREKAKQLLEFVNGRTIKESKDIFRFLSNDIDAKFNDRTMTTKTNELGLEMDNGFEPLMDIVGDLSVSESTAVLSGLAHAIDKETEFTYGQNLINELNIKFGDED